MIQRVTFRMDDIIEEIFPSLKIGQILIPIVDSDTSNDDDAMPWRHLVNLQQSLPAVYGALTIT